MHHPSGMMACMRVVVDLTKCAGYAPCVFLRRR